MKKTEYNLLVSFVKHCEAVLTKSPPVNSLDTRTYNSYRIARYKELVKIKALLERMRNENDFK